MNIIQKTCTAAAGAMLVMMSTIAPVAADGYWVDGYWDDASQTWIEGRWVETGGGQQSWNGGWSAGPYQEYANGAVINYDANGNRTSTVVTNVPVYSQRNGAWAGVTIGSGGNFGSTGCVPTALAVIMNHFGIGGSPLDFGSTLNAYGNYNFVTCNKATAKELYESIVALDGGENLSIISADPWLYYDLAAYTSYHHDVNFIDETTDYLYGSLKPLEQSYFGKIDDLDKFLADREAIWYVGTEPEEGYLEFPRENWRVVTSASMQFDDRGNRYQILKLERE